MTTLNNSCANLNNELLYLRHQDQTFESYFSNNILKYFTKFTKSTILLLFTFLLFFQQNHHRLFNSLVWFVRELNLTL